MVTRFSASEARFKAEQAKKTFDEQRQRDKELKKLQAKERAVIRVGFDKQRNSVISAAIDGDREIEVDSVFLFRELVDSGVQVVEEGLVKRQAERKERVVNVDELERIKAEILDHFDKFIDVAKVDLKGYYGGFQRFHRLNYDALYEAINSEWSWSEFIGDDVYFEEVPDDLKAKYDDYFEKINEKIKQYKGVDDEDDEEYDDFDDDELITGEYCFSEDDEELDVLRPSAEGNKLKIRWTSERGITFMNAPLLSNVGLAWLTTFNGQKLIEEVFSALSDSAERGRSSLKLDFSLSKDGWHFVSGGRKIYCCMPDELVDIIERQSFNIDDTKATDKSYSIKVSW
jgi:hypothetical protein